MTRIAKPPAVSAKMYRHFAAITVMATAALAMFADGEGRERLAKQLESKADSIPKAVPTDIGLNSKTKGFLIRSGHARNTGEWGSDGSDSGSGDGGVVQDSDAVAPAQLGPNSARRPAADANPGWTLSPAGAPGPRRRIVARSVKSAADLPRNQEPFVPPKMSQEDRDAMIAASRARSGSSAE